MFHQVDTVFNATSSKPIPGAQVQVYDASGVIAALFADQSGTPIESVSGIANTAVTDSDGVYDFWVADGTYDLRFFVGQSMVRSIQKIALDGSAATAVTTKANASALGVLATDSNLGAFSGSTIPPDQTAKQALQALETAVEERAQLTDLASTATGKGASLIGFSHDATYAPGTVGASLQRTVFVTDSPFDAKAGITTVEQARLNRAAINAAITFLFNAGGGVLRIPAGTYHIAAEEAPVTYADSYIYLRGGVHIEGAGMDSTRLVRASTYSMLGNAPSAGDDYTSNGVDFRVSGITLDGNPSGQNTPANLVYLANATNLVFESVRFLDCPGLHSLDLNAVKDISVLRCRFEGHDTALSEVFGGATYYPESIQISSAFASGGTILPCDLLRIRDCYFGPSDTLGPPICSFGNHTVASGWNASDVTVSGCTMEGMTVFGARPFCWRGGRIVGNTFRGCASGVYLSSANNSYDPAGGSTGIPASNSDIWIDGNDFIDTVGSPINVAAGGGDNVTSYAKAERVTISNNSFIDNTPRTETPLMFLTWANDLTVTGNSHSGTRRRAVEMRFCSNATINANGFDTYSADGMTVAELGSAAENTWQGQGLSSSIALTGNKMAGAGFYGINLAGALSNIYISGNQVSGIGSPNPRPAIILQSGIAAAVVEGNLLDGSNGGMTLGVDVRSGCTNIIVGDNQINGATSAPYSHAGTGVLRSGGAGSPSSVIIAPPGSTWTNSAGGAGATFFAKEGGPAAATGWAAK